jgi:hypothetical protein
VKIQLRKLSIVAMPTLLVWRKAASGRPITQGRSGVAGVPSSGHASKGGPQEPRRAPIPSSPWEAPAAKGNRRRPRQMAEQSYEPIVPAKLGNRRAPARGGHGTHWREGENKRTHSAEGNIGET